MVWKKFHHYCFTCEVSVITDHKPLVSITKRCCKPITKAWKNTTVDTPIQHQNTTLTRATAIDHRLAIHTQPQNKEIAQMYIRINTIKSCMDIQDHMRAGEIRVATMEDEHLSALAEIILHSWPSMKAEVQKELQPYSLLRDEIEIIDRISIKGRIIIILTSLQR